MGKKITNDLSTNSQSPKISHNKKSHFPNNSQKHPIIAIILIFYRIQSISKLSNLLPQFKPSLQDVHLRETVQTQGRRARPEGTYLLDPGFKLHFVVN